jgi:hypothetical protein
MGFRAANLQVYEFAAFVEVEYRINLYRFYWSNGKLASEFVAENCISLK